MLGKTDQDISHPLTPFDGYEKIDGESFEPKDDDLKRKKRIKLLIYIGIFLVLQTIVITVLALTVMQAHVPRAQLAEIDLRTLNYDPATPSFNMSFVTEIEMKNINWGPYKFSQGEVQFMYQGSPIGEAVIPRGKVAMRSTMKISVEVRLYSDALSQRYSSDLRRDLNRGMLKLTSGFSVHGNLRLMYILKKSKYCIMDDVIEFDLPSKTVHSIAHMDFD